MIEHFRVETHGAIQITRLDHRNNLQFGTPHPSVGTPKQWE